MSTRTSHSRLTRRHARSAFSTSPSPGAGEVNSIPTTRLRCLLGRNTGDPGAVFPQPPVTVPPRRQEGPDPPSAGHLLSKELLRRTWWIQVLGPVPRQASLLSSWLRATAACLRRPEGTERVTRRHQAPRRFFLSLLQFKRKTLKKSLPSLQSLPAQGAAECHRAALGQQLPAQPTLGPRSHTRTWERTTVTKTRQSHHARAQGRPPESERRNTNSCSHVTRSCAQRRHTAVPSTPEIAPAAKAVAETVKHETQRATGHGVGEHPGTPSALPPTERVPSHRSCCAGAGRRWRRRAWTWRAASPWSVRGRGLRRASLRRVLLCAGRSALSTRAEGCWLVSREIRAITYGRAPGAKARAGSSRMCRGRGSRPVRRCTHRLARRSPGSPHPRSGRGARGAPAARRGQGTEAQPPCPARTGLCGRPPCQGQTPLRRDLGSAAPLAPHGPSAVDSSGHQSTLTGNNPQRQITTHNNR